MALPKDSRAPGCSLSRSLEVLGARWTMLVVRDAFYGVRRFSDFADHLGIPRSVLSTRLESLVAHGVLSRRTPEGSGYAEYELTDGGLELWPIVHGLIAGGDRHYQEAGAPLVFEHVADGGQVN